MEHGDGLGRAGQPVRAAGVLLHCLRGERQKLEGALAVNFRAQLPGAHGAGVLAPAPGPALAPAQRGPAARPGLAPLVLAISPSPNAVRFAARLQITYKVAVTRDEKEALLEKSAQGSLGQAVGGATITSLTSSMER